MKKIRQAVCLRLVLTGCGMMQASAQGTENRSKDDMLTALGTVRAAYHTNGKLRFNVLYRYTNENDPSHVLDSLSGNFEIDGDNYRCVLDNTETMHNSRYTIMLFKEDKIMYIAGPGHAGGFEPMQMIDSALSHISDIKFEQSVSGSGKVLSVIFPEGLAYKRIDFTVDAASGYLLKTTYIVKTDQMASPELNAQTGGNISGYDAYARVEAIYSGFTLSNADASGFDEKNFFTREGKDFTVTDNYKDYKIFIGTPNL